MNTLSQDEKSIRLIKIGGILTAVSMLALLFILCIVFMAFHNFWWGFLIVAFIIGVICGASLMNAFVVTRFIKATLSPTNNPPSQ